MSTPPPPPTPPQATEPSRVRRLAPWLLGCGGTFVGCVGCASLVAVLLLGGGTLLVGLGLEGFIEQMAAELDGHPQLHEQIGDLTGLDLDLAATLTEPGEDTFVFTATGTRGTARITARCNTEGDTVQIVWARLHLPDGHTVELISPPPAE